MSKYISFLAIFSLVFCSHAAAQKVAGIAEVPDWVTEQSIGSFAEDRGEQFQQGIAHLLSDTQVRMTNGGYDFFYHGAYQVVDRAGLEDAARLTKVFDPTSETLNFAYVRVIRDDIVTDRLPDAEITMLRQESQLESSMIDGNLTAVIQLEDLRVGDIVEYAAITRVDSKLWPGEFFDAVAVEWSVPLAKLRYRLITPISVAMTTKALSTEIVPVESDDESWKTYELTIDDIDAVAPQANTPDGWLGYGLVVFSTMDAWSDVVDWALPIFSISEPLPAEFRRQLDDIASTYKSSNEQALQVLRWTQEEIRYLGLEVGLGSHVPRPPSVTLEKGYGDCKDKAVLLVAALEYLNISSFPALATLSDGLIIADIPARINAFNHVIVGIEIDDQTHWVDPTLTHQGGRLETLALIDYGYVLPIRDGTSDLVQVSIEVSDVPVYQIDENFLFLDDESAGLRLSVEYTYKKHTADFIRRSLANNGEDAFARQFIDYYADYYPGLSQEGEFSVSDVLDENIVKMMANYSVDADAFDDGKLAEQLLVVASAITDMVPKDTEAKRTAPMALPYGAHLAHRIRVETPGRMITVPEGETISTNGFDYARRFENIGEAFEINYDLVIKGRSVSPDGIPELIRQGKTIAKNAELTVNVSTGIKTLANFLSLPAPLPAETENTFLMVRSQLEAGNYVDALTDLNGLIDQHNRSDKLYGYLLLMKARALTRLDRERAAVAAYDEAFELYDAANESAYFGYIDALTGLSEFGKAAAALEQLLARYPNVINRLGDKWVSALVRNLNRSGEHEAVKNLSIAIARALHETGVEDDTDFRYAFADAVDVLAERGENEELKIYLEYMSNPLDLITLMVDNRRKPLWRTMERTWGKNLEKAAPAYVETMRKRLETDPTNYEKRSRYLRSLRTAGLTDEAIRFGQEATTDWSEIEAVGRDAYWVVNEYADALASAGKVDEAYAQLTRLEAIGLEENPALISMVINKITMQRDWGHFKAALEGITALENIGQDIASDYGWMQIYTAKACALHQLGKTDEAKAVMSDLVQPIAETSPSAYTSALICLGRLDDAADLLIERLQSEDDREGAIACFIRWEKLELAPFTSELLNGLYDVMGRPEVQKALKPFGRAFSIESSYPYDDLY